MFGADADDSGLLVGEASSAWSDLQFCPSPYRTAESLSMYKKQLASVGVRWPFLGTVPDVAVENAALEQEHDDLEALPAMQDQDHLDALEQEQDDLDSLPALEQASDEDDLDALEQEQDDLDALEQEQDDLDSLQEQDDLVALEQEQRKRKHVICFAWTSDQGPDEKGRAQALVPMTIGVPLLWSFCWWCVAHIIHLIVEASLSLMPGYYSNQANICHYWRSLGMPVRLYCLWEEYFGAPRAKIVCNALPPRPVKGRWGCVSGMETHLRRSGRNETRVVFHQLALEANEKQRGGKRKQNAQAESVAALENTFVAPMPLQDASPEERDKRLQVLRSSAQATRCILVALDDEKAMYELQIGRYRKEAHAAIERPHHWVRTHVRYVTGRPLDHGLQFLQKEESDKQRGNDQQRLLGTVARLIFYKFKDIADLWTPCLQDSALYDEEYWKPVLDIVDNDCSPLALPEALSWIVLHTTRNSSDWDWRVGEQVRSWPPRVLWLVRAEPDIDCPDRRRVARAAQRSTHVFPQNLVAAFPDEIELAAQTGKLPCPLWNLLDDVAKRWLATAQRVESANSKLRRQSKAAPNMRLSLHSDRHVIKANVGFPRMPPKNERQAWLESLACFYSPAKTILADGARWSKVQAMRLTQEVLDAADEKEGEPSREVATFCKILKKTMQNEGLPWLSPSSTVALQFVRSGAQAEELSVAFLPSARKWTYHMRLTHGVAHRDCCVDAEESVSIFHLQVPLKSTMLHCVLGAMIDLAAREDTERVDIFFLELEWTLRSPRRARTASKRLLGHLDRSRFQPRLALEAPAAGRRGRGKGKGALGKGGNAPLPLGEEGDEESGDDDNESGDDDKESGPRDILAEWLGEVIDEDYRRLRPDTPTEEEMLDNKVEQLEVDAAMEELVDDPPFPEEAKDPVGDAMESILHANLRQALLLEPAVNEDAPSSEEGDEVAINPRDAAVAWALAVDVIIATVLQCSLSTPAHHDLVKGTLSFVEFFDGDASFYTWVHWDNFGTKRGRFVTVEHVDGVCYINYVAARSRTDLNQFRDANNNQVVLVKVWIPSAGVRMRRRVHENRTSLPDHIFRMQKLITSAQKPEPADAHCALCHTDTAVLGCRICGQPLHARCADAVRDYLNGAEGVSNFFASRSEAPPTTTTTATHCCCRCCCYVCCCCCCCCYCYCSCCCCCCLLLLLLLLLL